MAESFDLLSIAEAEAHFRMYDNPPDVCPTPFEGLNQICRGFGRRLGFCLGWYIVVGGDTGQGKSLLALQMAVNASQSGVKVGFLSFEMSMYEVRNRFYSQALGIPSRDLEPGDFFAHRTKVEVINRLTDASKQAPGVSFYATDNVEPDVDHVMAVMDQWRKEGVRCFVVDYLQLLEARTATGTAQEVMKISAAMRDFAHRNQVLVIGLSQYNNDGGNDRTKSPHVGHLYGGRRISQDSDMTILLDHSRYERDTMDPAIVRTWVMVPKNRHGPAGIELPIEWAYTTLTAREGQPDEIDRWPTHNR
jgi:replicative DNA helicase